MSEGALLSARCRIRIFAPERVFAYFLHEQKVGRPEGRNLSPAGVSGKYEKELLRGCGGALLALINHAAFSARFCSWVCTHRLSATTSTKMDTPGDTSA